MSFASQNYAFSSSNIKTTLNQTPSSLIIPSITNDHFYQDLTNIILQISKQVALSKQQLFNLYSRFLQAKTTENKVSQYYTQTSQQISSQKLSNHQPFNLIAKSVNQNQIISLFMKMQTDLSLDYEKDYQYHALKNSILKKRCLQKIIFNILQDSKISRFNSTMISTDYDFKKLILENQNKQPNEQILASIPKQENQFHEVFKRIKKLKTMFGHKLQQQNEECQVFKCIFDMTQKLIISAGKDKLIKIWSRQTGHLLSNLKGHQRNIIKIIVSKCNKYLISTAQDGIRFFNLNSLKSLGCWISNSIVDAVTAYQNQKNEEQMNIIFSESKRLMILKEQVMLNKATNLQILTQKDFKCFSLQQVNKRQNNKVNKIILNKNKVLLLAFQSAEIVISNYCHLLLSQQIQIQGQNSHSFLPLLHVFNGHRAEIMDIKWNSTCQYLITGCKQGICQIWEYKNSQEKPNIVNQFKIPKLSPKRKKKQFACNYLAWNCTQTHILAAFEQILTEDDYQNAQSKAQGQILIYSIEQKAIVSQVSKCFASKINIASITSIDVHPKFPNILLFCDKSGKIFVIDIFLQAVVNIFEQKELQYPLKTLIPTQCHFSKDGLSFILSTKQGTISIYGYDISNFYQIAPDQQFLKTDYLPFFIHKSSLRPVVSELDQQLHDVNQISRGQVCNTLGARYQGNLRCDYVIYKQKIDKQWKTTNLKNIDKQDEKQFNKNYTLEKLQNFFDQIEIKGKNKQEAYQEFIENIRKRTQEYEQRYVEKSNNYIQEISKKNQKYYQKIQNQIQQKNKRLNQYKQSHSKICQGQQIEPQIFNSNKYLHKNKQRNQQKVTNNSKRKKGRPAGRIKKLYRYNHEMQDEGFQLSSDKQSFLASDQQGQQSESNQFFNNNTRNRYQKMQKRNIKNYKQKSSDIISQISEQNSDIKRQTINRKRGRLMKNNQLISNKIQKQNQKLRQSEQDQQFYHQSKPKKRNKLNQRIQKQNNFLCNKCMREQAICYCSSCKVKGFCNSCKYSRGKQNPFTCFNCKFIQNCSNLQKSLVTQQNFRQIERSNFSYIPQIGDDVYFFFQGYQQFISSNILYLNNSILEDRKHKNFNILPHQRNKKLCSHTPLCRVINYQYLFPLKQPRSNFYSGDIARRPRQQQNVKHIQMIIKLQILSYDLGSQQNSKKSDYNEKNEQFQIFFIPQTEFIVRRQIFEQAIVLLKNNKFKIDQIIKDNKNQQLQIVQVRSFDDRFPQSYWKYINTRKTDGKRLRANKSNFKQINIWNVNFIQNFLKIQFSSSLTSQSDLVLLEISKILQQQFQQFSLFFQYVDIQEYPSYRQNIEVGMCLRIIQQRVRNRYYRSIQSLKKDIQMIQNNSIIFNGEQNDITIAAKKLTKRLLRVIGLETNNLIKENKKKRNEIQKISYQPTIHKRLRKLNILDSDQQQMQEKHKAVKNNKMKDYSSQQEQQSQDYQNQQSQQQNQISAQDQDSEQDKFKKNRQKKQKMLIQQKQYQQEEYQKKRGSAKHKKDQFKNSKIIQNNNITRLRRTNTTNRNMSQQKIQQLKSQYEINKQSRSNQNQSHIHTRRSSRLNSAIQQNKEIQGRVTRRKLKN